MSVERNWGSSFPIIESIVLAVILPVTFVAYVYTIYRFRGSRFELGYAGPGPLVPPTVLNLAVIWFVVVVAASLALVAWERGQRAAPLVPGVLLLSHPWTTVSAYPLTPEIVLLLAFTLLAVGVEFLLRTAATLPADTAGTAVVAGVTHLVFGLSIQFVARPQWVSDLMRDPTQLLPLLGIGASLVVIGTVPILLWRRHQLFAPALILGLWLTGGIVSLLLLAPRLPLSDFTAPKPFLPAPDYAFSWPVLTILLLLGGAVEYALQRSSGDRSPVADER